MRLTLLVVGKTTDKHLDSLICDYCKRLTHYLSFELRVIPELRNAGKLTQEQIKQQEGRLILQQAGAATRLILLDERGKQYRSIDFAGRIQQLFNASRDVCFVVGGAYGFSQDVYDRAEGLLSLSDMTFSHQMIRLLFVEQLYRAMTILHGEPYHHE